MPEPWEKYATDQPVDDEAWRKYADVTDDSFISPDVDEAIKTVGGASIAPFMGVAGVLSGMGKKVGEEIPIVGPLAKKAGAGVRAIYETITDPNKRAEEILKTYGQIREAQDKESADYKKKYPIASTAQEMAGGFLLPAPFALPKAAATAGTAIKALRGGADIASKAAQSAAVTAADLQLRGASDQQTKDTALMTAGLTGAVSTVPSLLKGAMHGYGRIMGGVKPEAVKKYMARPNEIRAADEEKIYREFEADVNKQRDWVSEGKAIEQEAKISERELNRELREDIRAAQSRLSGERSALKEDLRAQAYRVPDEAVNDAMMKIKAIQENVSKQSGKAFDVLIESGAEIPLSRAKATATNALNEAKVMGVDPINTQGYDDLVRIREYLGQIESKTVSADDAKKIIQNVDEIASDIFARKYGARVAGQKSVSYVSPSEKAILDVRKAINDELYAIPKYAEAMAPVRESMGTLDKLDRLFGKKEKQLRAKLGSKEYEPVKESLEGIGVDTSSLGPYYQAKETLRKPSMFEEQVAKLPAFEDVQKAQRAQVEGSQAAAQKTAEAGMERADRQLYGDLLPAGDTQALLARYRQAKPNFAAKEDVRIIEELTGKPYGQQLDDLAVKEAFERPYVKGSRNVNVGAFSLAALAKALGAKVESLPVVGGIGSVVGASADIIGPKVYRAMIDATINPQFQKYANAINEAAKRGPQALAVAGYTIANNDDEFKKYLQQGVMSDENQRPYSGPVGSFRPE